MPLIQAILSICLFLVVCLTSAAALTGAMVAMARLEPAKVPVAPRRRDAQAAKPGPGCGDRR